MNPLKQTAMIAAVMGLLACAADSRAAYKDDIGYTDLANELGAGVPTGASITATQVESPEDDGDYAPDETNSEFSDTTITEQSGTSGPLLHATTVGRYLYGNSTSTAPDVNTVDAYDANDWISSVLFGAREPATESRDIQNHSWVGNMSDDSTNQVAMRRHDYMINESNFLATVGVNNGSSNSQSKRLMAHGYNSIAVGRSDGGHNYGDTDIDEPGRLKPEIVAPSGATSYATPMVGAAGAMLFETVDKNTASLDNARNSEAAKALLLAGATKDEFADWDRTTSRPLDQVYGAGELNIYNSYHALVAGEQESSSAADVNTMGWDFDQMPTDTTSGDLLYFFEVAENQVLEDLSAILTWNRDVSLIANTYNASLADLKMELYAASGYTLGSQLDFSDSSVDNIEHIYSSSLAGGRYALRLTGDTSDQDFALAWYGNIANIPEPTAALLLLLGGAALGRRRPRR